MTKIWIEEAECSVPRRGTQELRQKLHDEFERSHPNDDLHSQPYYLDPYGRFGGDDVATLDWTWMGEDQILMGWRSHVPVHTLDILQSQAIGKPRTHSKAEGGCAEYSFTLKASFALAVLKDAGKIPADSVLMNEDEMPISCEEALEQ